MIQRIGLAACVILAMAGPARAADPFAQPLKDCQPCRFSPGPGQPVFDLRFVFQGSGDQKALTGFDITAEGDKTPAGGTPAGGAMQHLTFDPVAVSDFPDGFTLDATDLNFDRLGDLSVITQEAPDNTTAAYWIYEPASRRFVPLERVGDDGSTVLLSPGEGHRLYSNVRGSILEYTTYAYRISGHRAVVVGTDSRLIEGALIVDESRDLSVTPPRLISRRVVGFGSDSPARNAFVKQLGTASARAEVLYRHGDAAGAAAAVAAAIRHKQLAMITTSYPIQGDAGDLRLVGQFNDYGFYLEQAKQYKAAIGVLSQVTDVDPSRIVAYLNLADAEYALGQKKDAAAHYAEYRKRMIKAGKQALIPARVGARVAS